MSSVGPIQGQAAATTGVSSAQVSNNLRGSETVTGSLETATSTGRGVENGRVSTSSLSIISQNTQPQSPLEFGTLVLAALLFGQDDDEKKNNPLMALLGLALLSGLQNQSSQAQYVQFDSQQLQISQSTMQVSSTNLSQTSYSQGATGGTGEVGGNLDISG